MELEADNAGITQILEAKVSRQLAEEESVSRYSLLGATPAVPEANSSDTASVKSQKSTSSTGHHKSNKNNALKGEHNCALWDVWQMNLVALFGPVHKIFSSEDQ